MRPVIMAIKATKLVNVCRFKAFDDKTHTSLSAIHGDLEGSFAFRATIGWSFKGGMDGRIFAPGPNQWRNSLVWLNRTRHCFQPIQRAAVVVGKVGGSGDGFEQ
jgi:hypothetical protein